MKLEHEHAPRLAFRRRFEGAFTLTEILITAAVIVVVAATATYALTLMNRFAISGRVQAAAQSVVQNQIDQILTRGPYAPTNVPPDVPTVLTAGTAVANDVPIFADPESGKVIVSGTLKTTIEDSGAKVGSTPLYVLKAAVALNYTFAGRDYTLVMNTLRAPDQ